MLKQTYFDLTVKIQTSRLVFAEKMVEILSSGPKIGSFSCKISHFTLETSQIAENASNSAMSICGQKVCLLKHLSVSQVFIYFFHHRMDGMKLLFMQYKNWLIFLDWEKGSDLG